MEYGTAFTSGFKSEDELKEAKNRWSSRLAHLTVEQIKVGVDKMTDIHKRFPPNLNEFISLCESYQPKCAAHRMMVLEHKTGITVDKDSFQKDVKNLKKLLQ